MVVREKSGCGKIQAVSEKKELIVTDELKKCPICGAASELNSLVCPDNKLMYWPNCSNADCCLSDKWEVKSGNREAAVSAWNRAPEPGTSVIRWHKYDGTPENMPAKGRITWWGLGENHERICDGENVKMRVGDLWAYIPEPEEAME